MPSFSSDRALVTVPANRFGPTVQCINKTKKSAEVADTGPGSSQPLWRAASLVTLLCAVHGSISIDSVRETANVKPLRFKNLRAIHVRRTLAHRRRARFVTSRQAHLALRQETFYSVHSIAIDEKTWQETSPVSSLEHEILAAVSSPLPRQVEPSFLSSS
jgi:hypothetical protein